jgi:ABC-type transport system involved in multi-copper enzyme maturation permease subunit
LIVGPIFVREAKTAPRRFRHYLARAAYGSTLFVLMWTAWQAIVGFQQVESAGDVARFGSLLFRLLSVVQLALALFFAPVVAGSSISAEKDRRTFELLLMTDLTNWEIVMGKLFGSLLQMIVLLASAFPIFAICLLLGGASFEQIARVFAVTAAAALACGALGILIACWRDKTFQTLALTLLVIVMYLAGVFGVFGFGETAGLAGDARPLGLPREAWRAILNPFEAVAAVLEPPRAELAGVVPFGRVEWAFIATMLGLTVLLLGTAIGMLRVWNPSGGKPTFARETAEAIERRLVAEGKLKVGMKSRRIWDNPVLWREMRTRAYGRRPIVIKLAYVLVFAMISAAFFLAVRDSTNVNRITIAYAVVPVIVTSLLLVNVQAVAAITSERDGRALDLLLVTDISPKEFIFGKIFGVLYNTKEMLVLPFGFCTALLVAGHVGGEVWFYLVASLLVLATFAITLGLHAALAHEQTRAAVLTSMGTMVFLFIGILICIFLILVSGRFESQAASFVLFICAGAVGMYVALGVRNRSTAIFLVSCLCPFLTWWAIAHFLQGEPGSARGGDPLGSFLAIAGSYGFAIAAMLVPAVSEFDVALGRTVAEEG